MNKKPNFETAELNLLRKKFLHDWSALEYKYNPPSALMQEKRYAEYGIKLPFKIYYNYKMPFGFKSSYDLLFWLPHGGLGYKMPDSAEKWAEINSIPQKDMREHDKKLMDFYRTFSYEQLKAVSDWLGQISPNEMIAEIKRLNPELAHIKTDGKTSGISSPLIDFIQGVAYGFPPEDIQFCLEAPHEEFHKILSDTRFEQIRHGHIPAPAKLDALLAAEETIKQIETQRKSGRE